MIVVRLIIIYLFLCYNEICNKNEGVQVKKMEKILIVEDDRELNQAIGYALEKDGYQSVSAFSVRTAMKAYMESQIDLVLLDVNLPDGEGFTFCKWVKERKGMPVIFLTARDLEEDMLRGYDLGAEDYVTKPFSMKVLLKKINIILTRKTGSSGLDFDDGFLRVDFEKAKIEVNGKSVQVTPTEFRLLRQFISNSEKLLTYDILLERLWDQGGQFVDKHALAVNVNRIRGKIEDGTHKYISNVYGMGYQWIG